MLCVVRACPRIGTVSCESIKDWIKLSEKIAHIYARRQASLGE